jgi:hypothetical protein
MADFPSYATLPETGDIQVTFVPSDVTTIDRINFYLELSGYNTEQRLFFQKLQQEFALNEVPAGTWTLTAIASSGAPPTASSAASATDGASASVVVTAGATIEVTMGTAASGQVAPSATTLLNRGNSYAWREDADTYFNTRFGASAWAALSDANKDSLLITAAAQLDQTFNFVGLKLDSGQQLEFPRFFRRGALVEADDMRFIPREVFEAVCEQALFVNTTGDILSERAQLQAEGVSSIGYGRAQEAYREGARPFINAVARERLETWIARTFKFNSFSPYIETG